MAAAASGSVSRIETVRAWSSSEFKGIAENAAKVAGAYQTARSKTSACGAADRSGPEWST
jgi:hypothetical protein